MFLHFLKYFISIYLPFYFVLLLFYFFFYFFYFFFLFFIFFIFFLFYYLFPEGLTKHWIAVKIQVVLSLLSVCITVWLAYSLFFVIQNICVVCITLYAINIAIAVMAIIRHQKLRQTNPSKTTQKKKAPAKKGKAKKA